MCLFQLQEMVNCFSEKFNIDQGLNSEHFRKGKFIKLIVQSRGLVHDYIKIYVETPDCLEVTTMTNPIIYRKINFVNKLIPCSTFRKP